MHFFCFDIVPPSSVYRVWIPVWPRGALAEYRTISIPYIEGDLDGDLNACLVRQLSRTGAFDYVNDEGGSLTLRVKVIDFSDDNIGFRYDRKKDGHLKKTIIPTETRLGILVEVSVIENCSGTILRGPVRFASSFDFDHEYDTSRNRVNIFSLGQLGDIDAASDVAQHPLNQKMAKKIVDYLCDSW